MKICEELKKVLNIQMLCKKFGANRIRLRGVIETSFYLFYIARVYPKVFYETFYHHK